MTILEGHLNCTYFSREVGYAFRYRPNDIFGVRIDISGKHRINDGKIEIDSGEIIDIGRRLCNEKDFKWDVSKVYYLLFLDINDKRKYIYIFWDPNQLLDSDILNANKIDLSVNEWVIKKIIE